MNLFSKVNTKLTFLLLLIQKNIFLTLLILGFLVFGNGLFNGFVLDDNIQIVSNPTVQSFTNIPVLFTGSTFSDGATTLRGNYYKPILSSVYSIIYSLFGSNAFPFHLLQLLLFILNAWFIYKLLQNWFSKNFSIFGGLVFLLHPINSETVLYIANLQDVLFMFFGLLGLYVFLNFKKNKSNLILIFIMFFLSILSKETGIAFYIILLIFQLIYDKKYLIRSGIYTIISAGFYLFLRINIAHIGLSTNQFAAITRLDLPHRLLQIPSIIEFYIKTFVFPLDLIAVQNWVVTSFDFMSFYFPLLISIFVTLIFFLLIHFSRKERIKKSLVFFGVWFFLGLLMHLQIQPLDATVSDHWFYFPIVGLIAVILIIVETFLNKKTYQKLLIITAVFLLVLFGFRSFLRTFDFRSEYALATHDVKEQPDNFVLQNSLGLYLQQQGDLIEAKAQFEKAIIIDPGNNMAWHNLGYLYEIEGAKNNDANSYKLADKYYQMAIKTGGDPNSYINLAELRLFKEHSDFNSINKLVESALLKYPNNPKLLLMHAITLYEQSEKQSEKQKALIEIKKAINIQPQNTQYLQIQQWMLSGEPINLTP